jgi:hypothetical protein
MEINEASSTSRSDPLPHVQDIVSGRALHGAGVENNLPVGRSAVRTAKQDCVAQRGFDLPICIRIERPPASASGISKDVLGVMATMV